MLKEDKALAYTNPAPVRAEIEVVLRASASLYPLSLYV
jgi:hypothetical protein